MSDEGSKSAFPMQMQLGGDGPPEWGLTKREWFAGMAMQGICAGLCAQPHTGEFAPSAFNKVGFGDVAKHSYQIADEMLTESQNGGEG